MDFRKTESRKRRLNANPPNRMHVLIPTADIRDIDVKLGRGSHTRHVGNSRLTDEVRRKLKEWTEADVDGKKEIVSVIVSKMRRSGARFLVRSQNPDFWYEISDEDAVAKTKQRFRDYRSDYARAQIIGTGSSSSSSSSNNGGLLQAESVSQELPVPPASPLVQSRIIGVERHEDECEKDIRPDDRYKEGGSDCLVLHGIGGDASVGKRTIAHRGKKRKLFDGVGSGADRLSESSSDKRHPAEKESRESSSRPEPICRELSDDSFARGLLADPFLNYHY